MSAELPSESRLSSLDQFRGYTVLGMFFVNFLSYYPSVPAVLRHHNTYCSYADTIMPQFFFAVGFAYRMVFLRRLKTAGPWQVYWRFVRRNLGLILIGFVVYHLDGGAKTWSDLQSLGVTGFFRTAFQRNLFQALVHIGVTSLWVMPVIGRGPAVRVAFAFASALAHAGLSYWFYYEWVWNRPGIDGGPLGFLTWTTPLVVGSLAYDVMRLWHTRSVWRMILWSTVLMVIGYCLSCVKVVESQDAAAWRLSVFRAAPPFMPPADPVGPQRDTTNMFRMSQRAGSISYLLFGAGFSLAIFAVFVWACDQNRMALGIFRTFGCNALAGYILHDLVIGAVRPYAPKDSPLWFAMAMFGLFAAITYLFLWYLERNRIYLRL